MADVIHNQNVIQTWLAPDPAPPPVPPAVPPPPGPEPGWYSRIGPAGLGIQTGPHETAAGALAACFRELVQGAWIFDPSFTPSSD